METDSLMEIDPVHRVEIFRMGNDTDEILEVHDFKNVSLMNVELRVLTRLCRCNIVCPYVEDVI